MGALDEGFRVTPRGFVRIGKRLGLKQLESSSEAAEHMDGIVQRLMEGELGKNVIQGYALEQLAEHFRTRDMHLSGRYSSYNFNFLYIYSCILEIVSSLTTVRWFLMLLIDDFVTCNKKENRQTYWSWIKFSVVFG